MQPIRPLKNLALLKATLALALLGACSSSTKVESLRFEHQANSALQFEKMSSDPLIYQQKSPGQSNIFFTGLREYYGFGGLFGYWAYVFRHHCMK